MEGKMFSNLDDEIKAEDQLFLEARKEVKKSSQEPQENEFGDRIGKKEILHGVVFYAIMAGLAACAVARGCQKINQYRNKTAENTKVIQSQSHTIE